MELKTCRNCKKFFNYVSGVQICPICKEKLEEKYQEVKDYIKRNRSVDIETVVEECEVEKAQIQQWVREGRLEFSTHVSDITCQNCGKIIPTGRYCDECKGKMANEISNALPKTEGNVRKIETTKNKEKTGMRFIKKK